MSQWNAYRAATASIAVAVFSDHTGGDVEAERADMVGDLICNLGHYCDTHGIDYDVLVQRALKSWAHEKRVGDAEYGSEQPPEVGS